MKHSGLTYLILLLCLQATTAIGQWRIVATFPNTTVNAVWFLDDVGAPNVGFVGLANGGLSRTSDRGRTWVGVGGGKASGVWDFTFKDSLTGWAASPIGVIKTTNGGLTWNATSLTAAIHSIYYHHHKVFANGPNVAAKISDDEGGNWFDAGPPKLLGTVFADDQVGFRTSFDSLFEYTIDGGVTWLESQIGHESWQPAYLGKGKTFVAASETFIGTDKIYESVDGGKSWFQLFDFGPAGRLTGTIRGDYNRLYVQSDVGIAVSTNGGSAWSNICGPPQLFDCRFWAHGDTVYAGDLHGALWMTPTGGLGPDDDYISLSDSALRFFTSTCTRAVSSFYVFDRSNCPQGRTEILQLAIRGGNNHFLLNKAVPLPYFVRENEPIEVVFYPGQGQFDTAQLYIQYQKNGSIRDTSIALFGQRISASAYTLSPTRVTRILANPCVVFDTLITIDNSPCDTLRIDSISAGSQSFALVTSQSFPIVIPPDSSATVELQFNEMFKGVYSDTLRVFVGSVGLHSVDNIPLLVELRSNISALEAISPSKLQFGTTSTCASTKKWLHIRNPLCRAERLRKVWLSTGGSGFRLTSVPLLPSIMAPDQKDSVQIEFAPALAGYQTARITIEYEFEGVVRDSIIPIAGTGSSTIAVNLSDSMLRFDSVSTCDKIEASTMLTNNACDSVEITTILGLKGSPFTIVEPSIPCWVKPGESKRIVVAFASRTVGTSAEKIDLMLRQGLAASSVPLILQGETYFLEHRASVSPLSFSLGTLTPCSIIDSVIVLRNTLSCDSLRIDSMWTFGTGIVPDFENLPRWMAPSDSIVIPLRFTAFDLPSDTDTLFVRFTSPFASYDTAITVYGRVAGYARMLDAAVSSIDFGIRSICDTYDTSITIRNGGCDTVLLSDEGFSGSGFSVVGGPFTKRIPPHDSLSVGIHFEADTSGGTLQNLSVLTINSNAENAPTLVGARAQIVYPTKTRLSLVPEEGIIAAGESVGVKLIADEALPSDLTQLDFRIDYNSDLLRYVSASLPNQLSSTDGKQYRLLGTPVIQRAADGTLATITFATYLSQDSETDLVLHEITPNAFDPRYQECVLGLSASDTILQFGYSCGERILQQALRTNGLSFDILSVSPEPTWNDVELSVKSAVTQECNLDVLSISGVVVKRSKMLLRQGLSIHTIDLQSLSDGTYLLNLRTATGSVTRVVRKIR